MHSAGTTSRRPPRGAALAALVLAGWVSGCVPSGKDPTPVADGSDAHIMFGDLPTPTGDSDISIDPRHDTSVDGDAATPPDTSVDTARVCSSKTECDDGISCTVDDCGSNGRCTNTLIADKCYIGGTCVDKGATNGGNTCQTCDPISDGYDWTTIACVSTLAGSTAGHRDGPLAQALFNAPAGIAVDPGGDVWIADTGNDVVRRISGGQVTTVAGAVGQAGFADGSGTTARFDEPSGMAVDNSGDLIVADASNNRVRRVTAQGSVSTVAGSGSYGYSDGPASSASFAAPTDVTVSADGSTIFVADQRNYRVRKIVGGTVSTVAGNGTVGNNNGPATTVGQLSYPAGVALDGADVVIADHVGCRLRRLSGGTLSTQAGGACGFTDGPTGQFLLPVAVRRDSSGAFYVADLYGAALRHVSSSTVTTVIGDGKTGTDDGPAAGAHLGEPSAVAVAADGTVYIADRFYHRIRVYKP